MCESYGRSLLRVSVAQICQALGWDAVQLTACDLLADVLQRHIQQMGRVCHRYSELYGRTDPVLDDVSQAFRLLGVSQGELDDYVNNLEPVAFPQQLPAFPVSKNNVLQFPQPAGAFFVDERKEHIPDYMPPLVSLHEEEEEVLPDMGTSAEAMQVAMEEDEDDFDEDETVNDENHPFKRPLDSPDEALGMMPTSKRPRTLPGLSPEWGAEPREPLTSLNPQRVAPPGTLPSHDNSLEPLSPGETPPGAPPSFRPPPAAPKYPDPKTLAAHGRKPKVSSPGRQRTKSPKGLVPVSAAGSPVRSPPKTSKERKKSPGRAKSPKSPKSPKTAAVAAAKAAQPPSKTDGVHKPPLPALGERLGKENIHLRQNADAKKPGDEGPLAKTAPDNGAIEDSISAVIAKARSERRPADPFAFSSGSDSDSNGFSSPRRLTIMEPLAAARAPAPAPAPAGASAPLHLQLGPAKWTLDDSIDEVIRKVHQGGPSSSQPPHRDGSALSSGSASPPTPEPLLKVFEEKAKLSAAAAAADVKKKLKKELRTKLKKKEKPKDKSKLKNKEKNKSKDASKLLWKEFGLKEDELLGQRDFALPECSVKARGRDGDGGGKKDKDRHKDKKKEKGKKEKEKKDKGKDKSKEERQKQAAAALGEVPPLFSPASCQRLPPVMPSLMAVLLPDAKSKEKDKKKDKKEKKKKKEKEREKAKEKEREKEEKRKEKEREKEKRDKEKEKEKERLRLEKMKAADTPLVAPSPVIPRLTLRVGGQDKIVISKVLPNAEAKVPTPKTPAAKSAPASRPRSPPPPPVLLPGLPCAAGPPSPLAPPPAPSSSSSSSSLLLSAGPLLSPAAASLKMPVRSVVTETVSTYVIRDESGNQIWICPGCDKPDDGSPMIGCDDCDDWYHWVCVGIVTAPPADQQWFCVKCSSKKKDKKHKKKKHKPH
ncbi:transcription initiation factor TFIID subunit 3 isoform X2 [Festucalex cinctus]